MAELPELPPPDVPDLSGKFCLGWSAVRMREYARAAVQAERERILAICADLMPKNERSDWTHYAEDRADLLDEVAAAIRGQAEGRE